MGFLKSAFLILGLLNPWMSLKILFPLRSVLLQRYLKLAKYPCVPLYFPATPVVRQDHVTLELNRGD